MSPKGKQELDPRPTVGLTVLFDGDLIAGMHAELARRFTEEHRDESLASYVRESVRKNLAGAA